MIRSMTGYGRAQEVLDGLDITVEIKSVNHRYFEFSARTPRAYGFLDEKIKSYLQSRVNRGKVDVYVAVESLDTVEAQVEINDTLAAGYVKALRELSQRYQLPDDVTVSTVAGYHDIFTVRKTPENEERIWAAVSQVLSKATDDFIAMRETEGTRMAEDVRARGADILEKVAFVEQRSPETVAAYRAKLEARLKEVLADKTLDERMILNEAAIFADKTAVAEETIRLRSHISQLYSMLDGGSPIGRKLDFLVQEINRETNTIGSKAQDVEIARVVVDVKAEIEKIREQIQNIE
nr:YicC/YloC family endoribonuclease [uncultured Solibaculum sp.]